MSIPNGTWGQRHNRAQNDPSFWALGRPDKRPDSVHLGAQVSDHYPTLPRRCDTQTMAVRTPFAFAGVICVGALLLAQLATAQVNPVPLPKNDPNYVKVDIELLKKVKDGDDGLRKRYVAYYINVRCCCSSWLLPACAWGSSGSTCPLTDAPPNLHPTLSPPSRHHVAQDFGCAANPDRARNVITRLYAWRDHDAAGVLDTLNKIMSVS